MENKNKQVVSQQSGEMVTETQTIKERYNEIQTYGDGIRFCKSLSGDELIKFSSALQIVKDNFGITMRDDCLLGFLESEKENRLRKSKEVE